jgi:hypothetical protein
VALKAGATFLQQSLDELADRDFLNGALQMIQVVVVRERPNGLAFSCRERAADCF